MHQESLDRIVAIFDRYCIGQHFYLKDLRTGETFEAGVKRRYPICSCFKLAVLVALFEKSQKESADLRDCIEVTEHAGYNNASILAALSGPVTVSWLDLAQLMISASDGWATDLIIRWVGLASVNDVLHRHANESNLPLNLHDMLAQGLAIPTLQQAKQAIGTEQDASDFLDEVAKHGFTNGKDLALLANSTFAAEFSDDLSTDFERIIGAKRYAPRTEMFFNPDIQCLTKTGSLVRRYFMNECGIFRNNTTGKPIACFGYCSHGWLLPAMTCETIGGLIGLEIASALELDPVPNWDWSEATASMFLGGL